MTDPARRALAAGLGLALALGAAAAAPAAAELRCQAPGTRLRWPEEQPVWELCWLDPGDTGGAAGSGLELREVRFRGILVLARAQVPVVWAELGGEVPGCSDRCFRTWTCQPSELGARGEVVPGYFEIDLDAPPGPGGAAAGVRTICDRPAGAAPGECPWGEAAACSEGVAVERWEDGFRLTTQLAAGWFRYVMRWTFHRDGTIEPRFGFARGSPACAGAPTVDSVVWRLDVDIGGRNNRFAPVSGGPTGPATGWQVRSVRSDLGYRLTAGAGDLDPGWRVTGYDPDVLTDLGTSCAFDLEGLDPLLPVEPPGETGSADPRHDPEARVRDPVLWYRASASGVAEAGCGWVGPTLVPIGAWPPPRGDELFADGFESGGLERWVTSDAGSEDR